MRGKFTISSIKFHVKFFSGFLDNAVRIRDKCRLFSRKWHVMERCLMWQNGILYLPNTIQAREKLPNVHVVQ